MPFADAELVHVYAEFLALGGGSLWDRVEDAAWLRVERERERSADKQKTRRATVFGKRAHARAERERRQRDKTRVVRVRACRLCKSTFGVTAAQVADRTGRFCSPRCAGRWRRARHAPKPTRLVTIGDKTLPLPTWAERLGISLSIVYRRMREGMSPVEALTAPKTRAGGRRRAAA